MKTNPCKRKRAEVPSFGSSRSRGTDESEGSRSGYVGDSGMLTVSFISQCLAGRSFCKKSCTVEQYISPFVQGLLDEVKATMIFAW